ncbi:MAG TPA: transglutaminase family protein [Puia sp.]|uniref:transglutaminase family protein n=1 Tax=Puia sp. TaxID=2045100 RepID=UPI002C108087|nr:transglutaminase family protein [Puia sp.]HVU96100.1 transglutaminase family protein [Puia sp.]
MQENKEILALFHLIDDPDQEVFDSVSSRIVSYGRGIIPNLESLWENTISNEVQERIELLIHKLHYHDLTEDFNHWKNSSYQDLLTASLLVAKFQFPDLITTPVLQEVEKLRRNIWLELNSYLTPLEQVHVVTSILYNYYGLKGTEVAYQHPEEFLINKLIETKRGNSITNGILYLLLSELLDIPVKAINIPRQFVLAYIKPYYEENPEKLSPLQRIEFFIDPTSGQVFSHKDVESYFKRISVPPVNSYFKPLTHNRIIQTALEEFSKCFDDERNAYKQKELLELAKLLCD